MAMTDKEKQEAYRERMYAAGYKQMRIWVPRNSEGKQVRMDRRAFISCLEELTAGWSRARLSRLFADLLKTVKRKKEEKRKA